MSSDFWDELLGSAFVQKEASDFAGQYLSATAREEEAESLRIEAAVEGRITGRALDEGSFRSVRALTDRERERAALRLPVAAGARVTFEDNIGSVLAYEDPPVPGSNGTVVAVKSASGDITSHDGKVFVRWDDKVTRAIHAEHLRRAAVETVRVASLGDLSEFLRVAGTPDTLVHKATRDLWKVSQDGSDYVIERLFRDDGAPIKV